MQALPVVLQIGAVETVQSASAMQVTHWPARVPTVEQTGLVADRVEHAMAAAVWQPAQALATQKLFAAVLQSESAAHSTHVPMEVPPVAHTGLVASLVEQAVAGAVWQPVHALATQKLLLGSLQSVSPMHSTQVPAAVPLAEQTGLVAALAEHAVAGAAWQPTQALATQKLFVGSLQSTSAEHSTHVPAVRPLVEHTGLAADLAVHAVAEAVWQPSQALATQKLFAGSLQLVSPAHSTHRPAAAPLVAQVVFPSIRAAHPVAPVLAQPVHALATQKPLAGSLLH
jgi:hypothetical protein